MQVSNRRIVEDREIVTLFWNRDQRALSEAQLKYGKYLFSIAYHFLSNYEDSEECVNDSLLATWNSIPPNKPVFLKTFMLKILRRKAIDTYRKKKAASRIPSGYAVSLDELVDYPSSDTNPPLNGLMKKELVSVIESFLKTQSKETRVVFMCRYFFMDSIKEIAQAQNMSESKVKSILMRVRKRLNQYLEALNW
jgi:RNA polymerase sigma-70 factor (ECF subfamily)